MIFDTLAVLMTAVIFSLTNLFFYGIGKGDKEKKKRKNEECDGWAEILGYDHSGKGGVRDDKTA
jgi:hypothetical protein